MPQLPLSLPRVSRPLLLLALAMLVLACAALAGIALDPRTVTGAPAWLKPLKFSLSICIYALGFGWLLGQVQGRPRLVRVAALVSAAALWAEIALIALQAARGVPSHFNVSTTFDNVVFQTMAVGILTLWVSQIAIAVVLVRQRFEDAALGHALRLGLLITILGAGVGWLMTVPSAAQIAEMQRGLRALAGAHSVGGPDGGPGLWLLGWSRDHGDLRVPHFVGLHALQLLPLLALALQRIPGLAARARSRLVLAGAASYLGLVLITLQQALRGQPLISLDRITAWALAAWIVGTAAAAALALAPPRAAEVAPR
jgi:hypothetical protein